MIRVWGLDLRVYTDQDLVSKRGNRLRGRFSSGPLNLLMNSITTATACGTRGMRDVKLSQKFTRETDA